MTESNHLTILPVVCRVFFVHKFYFNMSNEQRDYLTELSQNPFWTFTQSNDASCPMNAMLTSKQLIDYMAQLSHPVATGTEVCVLIS